MNKIVLSTPIHQDDVFVIGRFYTYKDGTLYLCNECYLGQGINLVNIKTGYSWSDANLIGVKASSEGMALYTGKITIN